MSASPPIASSPCTQILTSPIARKPPSLELKQRPQAASTLLDSLMGRGETGEHIVERLVGSCQCSQDEAKSALRYMLLLASSPDHAAVKRYCVVEKKDQASRAWYLHQVADLLFFQPEIFVGYSDLPEELPPVVESFAQWTEEREKLLRGEPFNPSEVCKLLQGVHEGKRPFAVAAGLLVEICYREESASLQERLQFVGVLNRWMETLLSKQAPAPSSTGLLIDKA